MAHWCRRGSFRNYQTPSYGENGGVRLYGEQRNVALELSLYGETLDGLRISIIAAT